MSNGLCELLKTLGLFFISSHPDIFYVGDKKKREKDIKTNFGFPNPSNPFAPKEEHKNPWDFDPNKKNPWEF